MQVPARRLFEAIHWMARVHQVRVVRVHVRADRVGANHFRIANRWLRHGSRKGVLEDVSLWLRGARRHEHKGNDDEIFHGSNKRVDLIDSVGGGTGTADWGDRGKLTGFAVSSSANGLAEPPIMASARSIVCRT